MVERVFEQIYIAQAGEMATLYMHVQSPRLQTLSSGLFPTNTLLILKNVPGDTHYC